MNNREIIRERYLSDAFPIQLGGLAANLARIRSFSGHPEHDKVVEGLIDESKHFIEWAAPSASLEVQEVLVEIQLILAQWHLSFDRLWNNPLHRARMATMAQSWSEKVLHMSGLLASTSGTASRRTGVAS